VIGRQQESIVSVKSSGGRRHSLRREAAGDLRDIVAMFKRQEGMA